MIPVLHVGPRTMVRQLEFLFHITQRCTLIFIQVPPNEAPENEYHEFISYALND